MAPGLFNSYRLFSPTPVDNDCPAQILLHPQIKKGASFIGCTLEWVPKWNFLIYRTSLHIQLVPIGNNIVQAAGKGGNVAVCGERPGAG